jgi:hypothetical protein
MLGFAETGQVRVNGGDDRAAVAEVHLDLTEVLALLQQMRGIGMTQRVNVRFLANTAGFERETKGALQRGAAHRLGGSGSTQSAVALGRKDKLGMTMTLPLFAQQKQRPFRERDITTIGIRQSVFSG